MQFTQFFIEYSAGAETRLIRSSDLSCYENEELRLEFLLEEMGGDKRYQVRLFPKRPLLLHTFHIDAQQDYSEAKNIYCNGFQSWTESKMFNKNDRIPAQRKLVRKIAAAYSDGLFYAYSEKPGVLHSWTYTYVQFPKRRVEFLGSLNEQNAYTIFEHHAKENFITIRKDCEGWRVEEEILLADVFATSSTEFLCFRNYFEAQHLKPLQAKPALGWTSWYYYYTQISEDIIGDNLDAFIKEEIPIGIFQIDDGYQKAVGDWLHFNERFPNGLKPLVEKIHSHHIKAGLWLAPLACEHNSFIVREHPDWILKDENGKFLKIGFNPMWSYWFYALDIYNDAVRAYLRKVFDTVLNEWNFDLVKLDFLYGTALLPRKGRARGQIMQDAMQFLRECAGDKMILGCGVPLSAAIGTTDYCRIGPDIHLKWEFKLLKWLRARERPSTRTAIHNTISRRQLSGKWFWNDPDVFLLRDKKNGLSKAEQYSLLLANLLFGHLLFTSDNISEYDTATLALYKSIFPLMQPEDVQVQYADEFYTIHFRIRDRYYLALVNTGDTGKFYKLPDNLYFDNVKEDLVQGGKMIEIDKHSSRCYLKVGYTPFAIAGSKGHFFAGAEIEHIYLSGNKVELEWTPGMLQDVKIFIKVPTDYPVEAVNNSGNFKRIEKKDFSIIEIQKRKL